MYKKILVPTDGSEFAQKAEKHALFLAKTTGADIMHLVSLKIILLMGFH